jgi:DNA-binding response OmpR family regulator
MAKDKVADKQISILIIDDEPAIAKLLFRALSRHGYNVTCSLNFKNATVLLDQAPYDMIVTDVVIPGGTLDELFHYLDSTNRKNVPVIGMSGTPWRLNDYDFTRVLPKPFSMGELLTTIQAII